MKERLLNYDDSVFELTKKQVREIFKNKYPYNLISDMLRREDGTVNFREISSVDLPRFISTINDVLTSRSIDILYLRYSEHLTYDAIASKAGVTRERVRQIVSECLQSLRNNFQFYLMMPFDEYRLYSMQLKEQIADKDAKIVELQNYIKALEHQPGSQENETEENETEEILVLHDSSDSIDNLSLSTRAYNCLLRGNITTHHELSRCTQENLLKIRCLGPKVLSEIVEKAKAFNIDIPVRREM